MNALTADHTTFLGMVITHWDGLQASQQVVDVLLPLELRKFGGRAFNVKIPLDNQLESLGPGANTTGANAYRLLADEVLRAVQLVPDTQERAEVTSQVREYGME